MAEVSKGFAPLEERIRKEGRVLPGNIIKIDGFLNHRVDMQLMHELSHEFLRRFDTTGVTLVMTVEASGIALASAVAADLGVPLLYAKKAKSDNIEGGLFQSEIMSYTYKRSWWASARPWRRGSSPAGRSFVTRATTWSPWPSSRARTRWKGSCSGENKSLFCRFSLR